ncbi:MAG: hypothetical protein IT359_19230 [Gemmatimonadaceae bacterium]|nr:hypothetical protein [Gemmatimonadaceae bacterium]
MIDLHTHLLPGVDDGSRTLDNSVRVLERFVADGVHTVACTSHLNASQAGSAPVAAHAELRAQLQGAAPDGIRLLQGFEIMLDRPGCDLTATGLHLGESRAVLVEFPRSGLPAESTSELLRLRAAGLVPVIAHPERYRGATLDTVREWREAGVVIQGDAMALLSTGPVTALSRAMLEEGLFDILASDNHGDRRTLATVRQWLREFGADAQGALLTEENPRRVLAGEVAVRVPPVTRERTLWERLRAMFARR